MTVCSATDIIYGDALSVASGESFTGTLYEDYLLRGADGMDGILLEDIMVALFPEVDVYQSPIA